VNQGHPRHGATTIWILSVTALFAGLLAACDGPGGATALTAAADAESAIDDFFAAINAGATDRVLAHYHEGDELVQMACTEVRRGYGRVASMVRMWQEDVAGPAIQHQVVRSVTLGEDAAVVAAQGRNQEGLALFWTFVLLRDGGNGWRIVQEHQSWPDCREPRIHPMGE